jgi:hypothetical protein
VLLAAAVALSLVAAGCARGGESAATRRARDRAAATAASQSARSLRACGTRAAPPRTYDHVIWIWMQNRKLDDVVGSSEAPFLNALANACGIALNYSWVGHPTHIHATAGRAAVPSGCEPSPCGTRATSVFSVVKAGGRDWRAYEEDMSRNCRRDSDPPYVVEHNPPLYYDDLAADCRVWDVPMGTTRGGAFVDDLARDGLPAFSFVSPGNCNNTHDCDLRVGDEWLRGWVPEIVASPGYRRGTTALFIVFDTGGDAENCLTNQDRNCLVPVLVVSPFTPPATRSRARFSHYSLLRTTEELLGVGPLLAGAATAASMRPAFGL